MSPSRLNAFDRQRGRQLAILESHTSAANASIHTTLAPELPSSAEKHACKGDQARERITPAGPDKIATIRRVFS